MSGFRWPRINPTIAGRFHILLNLWGVVVWLVLLPPTILWWHKSVPYVVFMSWYANFVGHISAFIAANTQVPDPQNRIP